MHENSAKLWSNSPITQIYNKKFNIKLIIYIKYNGRFYQESQRFRLKFSKM